MAKKKSGGLDEIFRKPGQPAPDEPNPVGVKLTQAELDLLTAWAVELGISRHILLQYAVRDFMRRWEAGERPRTKTITKTETLLDM
jgi:hypothetical protein